MTLYTDILHAIAEDQKLLAILIDPDKFPVDEAVNVFAKAYLEKIPLQTTHLFVGGSTDPLEKTEGVVRALKQHTTLPIILFPGNYKQVTPEAHGILFLSLLSGRNPEYLIGQQMKGARAIKKSALEVLPTGYLLIDGGVTTAVQRVSETLPMPQDDIAQIVTTALAGQYSGKQCIYLEAGSGARVPVRAAIISAVKDAIDIPLIVGGGIRSPKEMEASYAAGADLIVIGTACEEGAWENDPL